MIYASGGTVSVTGRVIEVDVYGHARLNIPVEQFHTAGFAPGDIVTVQAGTFEGDMPFFDGYYVERGEFLVCALPGEKNISVGINYGQFAEMAGIDIGDRAVITLKEKGGALMQQELNHLVYTDDRKDYDSDETFGNFRAVTVGKTGRGRLYRSASPVSNEHERASVVNALAEAAGIRTVLNMGDTFLEVLAFSVDERFDSTYYMDLYTNGQVIALGMSIDYQSEEFNEKLIRGLSFLAEREPPYLIHCTEGKDRTGFAVMLLEALMGAGRAEIEEDYLLSYVNYYHLNPQRDTEKLSMIAERNIRDMLRWMTGWDQAALPEEMNLKKCAEKYLLGHGMKTEVLERLKKKLQRNA